MNTVLRAQIHELNLIQNYLEREKRKMHVCGLLLVNLNIKVSILLLSKYLQNKSESQNVSLFQIEIGLAYRLSEGNIRPQSNTYQSGPDIGIC